MKKEMQETSDKVIQQRQQKPLLKSVHCNYLPVTNLEQAAQWYEQSFGLTRFKPDGSIMVLGDGQWLFLIETSESNTTNFRTNQWDGEDYEMFSLTFEVENIVELHKRLREGDTEVSPLVDQDSCGLQFTFKDPDGNKFNAWQDTK